MFTKAGLVRGKWVERNFREVAEVATRISKTEACSKFHLTPVQVDKALILSGRLNLVAESSKRILAPLIKKTSAAKSDGSNEITVGGLGEAVIKIVRENEQLKIINKTLTEENLELKRRNDILQRDFSFVDRKLNDMESAAIRKAAGVINGD